MKLGIQAMETLRSEVSGLLVPGEELIVVGGIALSGTVALLNKKKACLSPFFSDGFLSEAENLFFRYSIYQKDIIRNKRTDDLKEAGSVPACEEDPTPEITAGWESCLRDTGWMMNQQVRKLPAAQETIPWKRAKASGADALLEAGEGGVLAALWKMAEASQVGLRADLRKIPVRQETIEICERLDVNPYKLFSKGCLLAGMKNGAAFVSECRREGYPAEIIGETNTGNDRLLYSGENARYLERPGADEWERFR